MASLNWPLITPTAAQGSRELIERLRWVIGLRWTVVIALLLVGLYGRTFQGDSFEKGALHVGLALLVLGYNFLYLYLSKRPNFGSSSLIALVRYSQVPIDLVVL